jgi:hypothetical protein
MKTFLIKSGVVASLALSLSACVVTPVQPVTYRMTSVAVPTYVTQTHVSTTTTDPAPATVAQAPAVPATTTTTTTTYQQVQPVPVYVRPVVPAYYYRPVTPVIYASPFYVHARVYF